MEILEAGFLTTVQDAGRAGRAAEGFSECGACDPLSYRVCELAAGNARSLAALEFTVVGPRLRFDEDAVFALAGPALRAKLDGAPVPAHEAMFAPAGSVLDAGAMESGMRGYLSVRGGFRVPAVSGSFSTDLKCGIGGFEGRKLKRGDRLSCGPCGRDLLGPIRAAAEKCAARVPRPEGALGILPGPDDGLFPKGALRTLTGAAYTVRNDSGRMGMRLDGPSVLPEGAAADILSGGIVPGCVEISSDGRPIVMLADCQTTGGYARIACVIPTDLPLAAQARPGDPVRFRAVTRRHALRELKKTESALREWQEELERSIACSR